MINLIQLFVCGRLLSIFMGECVFIVRQNTVIQAAIPCRYVYYGKSSFYICLIYQLKKRWKNRRRRRRKKKKMKETSWIKVQLLFKTSISPNCTTLQTATILACHPCITALAGYIIAPLFAYWWNKEIILSILRAMM